MSFSAVILAGGKSSRMGRDKARLGIGGRQLLARQIELVRETGAGEILVSGRADEDYLEFGCPVLTDRFEEAGPLAGIERALARASAFRLMVVAVDMPNLTPLILQQVIERGEGSAGAIPRVDGRTEPLAAIYPKTSWDLAVSLLDNGIFAAKTFADRCVQARLAVFCDFDAAAAHYFASWNRPSDVLSEVA